MHTCLCVHTSWLALNTQMLLAVCHSNYILRYFDVYVLMYKLLTLPLLCLYTEVTVIACVMYIDDFLFQCVLHCCTFT